MIQARDGLIHQRQRRIGLGQARTGVFGLLLPQHGLHIFDPLYADDPRRNHHAQHRHRQQTHAKAAFYTSTCQSATLPYKINQNLL